MTESLLNKVETHIINCYREHARDYLVYHNLMHTREVVIRSMEISESYSLDEDDLFKLLTAAWFHDVGHLYTTIDKHEKASVFLMRDFLQQQIGEDKIMVIENLILATRFPTFPRTDLEKILCDADMFHLGTSRFFMMDALIKQELQMRTVQDFSDWDSRTLQLLKTHQFYTPYCKNKLDEEKEKNIQILKNKITH